MITKDEIQELLHSTETYRVERTTSTGDMDKFQEAICAFANDLPNSRKNGFLILGANDNGTLSGLKVTDDLLKKIAAIRSNGNILPIPVMSVDRFQFPEGDLLVAEVSPSDLPPVRYRGRTFIRIGPRRDIATEAEERILAERRMSFMATFDTMPCLAAKLNDVNTDLLRTKYLIPLLGNELVESDTRPIEEQMAAVGMYDTEHQCPTYAAVVLFGYKPRRFMPGLYVQYVCFKGEDVTSEVENEMQLEGNYCELLPRLESLLELSVIKKKPVFVSILREEMVSNYPYQAIRELLLNACMHRDMQSNTPLRFYEFASHLEILNAGSLYGNARPENFPSVNDYRNPLVASAMETLGYVNFFISNYPQAYAYLQSCKEVLDARDKGEGYYGAWYAFGRTQAIADSGKKLLFPYMSDLPHFIYMPQRDMMIYCGYAIYSESETELLFLKRVLESSVFDYYMRHTSKPYSTGYYSYAKNYVKSFGIYPFNDEQKIHILSMTSKKRN